VAARSDRPGSLAPRSELRLRVVSALVLAPVVLALVWAGGPAFALLCAVTAGMVLMEWTAVVRSGRVDAAYIVSVAALTLALGFVLAGRFGAAGACVLAGAALAAIAARSEPARPLWAALGPLCAGIVLLGGPLLRFDAEFGLAAMLWVLILVWASDTGAFVAGRSLGGPKLWAAISPNKTWAGVIGGLLLSALAGGLCAHLAAGTPLATAFALSASFGLVAQAGDLLESAFKRRFSVKDAGRLIPGHGGILDRVDSLAAVLAVAAALGLARSGSAAQGLLVW